MLETIRRTALQLRLLFTPRTGKRRGGVRLVVVPAPSTWTETPPTPLPAHRSPYGLDEVFDGAQTVAVRPYLAAHEQRLRRRELAMASMGMDVPGPCWIHGVEVA
ncbi:hypothetical protein IHE56_06565 [Streptomyces sp. ID01-12c]|uniref:Uncharacterized protein n=1 Tax=Streptomyces caniscabiei TaxID=2746961 RepID=A0A927L1U5_9ACTN|nr:hypothetical protein [Streptomyces caniscabiei]MBD9701757.1 hypothetical protein [Streptomyces caniscabiei]MBD9724505.1 hypothetical protein [Streptomyces caniscabiei]MDX3507917.1 hypothetical protein [Streptomyces caniscabiei]MDX3717879.1 hypothetical protein [Streptomyces caniscabiei]MDX3726453.1 hypothetical protein [Streptomyces caniscabiei]